MRGVDRVLPLHDGTDVTYDVDIEVMELPYALRASVADVGRAVPYLSAGLEPHGGAEDELHVGIVWEAGEWDAARSLPLDDISPLAQVGGVKLYSLRPQAFTGTLPIETEVRYRSRSPRPGCARST